MQKPNFIVIFTDNLGYGDLGCYGSTLHRTPNVDRLAEEGMRFTSFYSTSGVCTPSRASMMTGCYPRRVNMHVSGEGGAVLRPIERKGLNPAEKTVAAVNIRSPGSASSDSLPVMVTTGWPPSQLWPSCISPGGNTGSSHSTSSAGSIASVVGR